MGKIIDGAETFMSFIGGNRSFPAAGNMDDRRHRLFGLAEGDTAMFRGKDDKQQFHMTGDGGFWSSAGRQGHAHGARASGAAAAARRERTADGRERRRQWADRNRAQQQQQRGQKPVKDDNQKSKYFVEVNASKQARIAGSEVHSMLDDGKVYVHVADDKKVYLGGKKGEHTFSPVMTAAGPSINVLARIDLDHERHRPRRPARPE